MDKLIGNTPIIKIKYKYNNEIKYVYVKLEQYNLTGSIKDRIALHIIESELENGNLKKGQAIVEVTSGNTGIAFSAIGAIFGHEVHIFMPDWVSIERRKLIEMYGAEVHLVSREEGGFKKCIELADNLAKKINGYRPNQFSNLKNLEKGTIKIGVSTTLAKIYLIDFLKENKISPVSNEEAGLDFL